MPTTEEAGRKIRGDLDIAAQRAAAVVEVVEGELTRMAADASKRARTVSQAVIDAQSDLTALLSADTLPMEFTGIIHDYRFGMFAQAPSKEDRFKELKRKVEKKSSTKTKAKVKPSHRFEVEVPNVGLWLHVRCSSSDFEEFLMSANGPQGEEDGSFDPTTLNGKTVTVRRDPNNNRLVPIGLGTVSVDPTPLGTDKGGNKLFKGDMVRLRQNRFERLFKATVINFANGSWSFQRKDRKNPTIIRVASLATYVLFEKIDKDGNAVPPPPAPAFPALR